MPVTSEGEVRTALVRERALPILPGYQIVDPLGEGGMGVVYRAVDLRTGREVALKLLASGADAEVASRRFRREFRAAARLRHPHVAQVFDMHTEPPLYYTLELVDGFPLDRVLLPRQGDLNEPRRRQRLKVLLGQILVALDVVHAADLVHRDLKPENILVTRLSPGDALGFEPPAPARQYYQPLPDGERLLVKLVDFGLAWVGDQSGDLTKTGIIVGTVDYISPEQVLGAEVDARADLYSLGVVLFQALTGRPPFAARDTVSLLLKHAYEEAPAPSLYNPQVEPELDAFTLRLLAKDPADRFPSAREALAALASDPGSAAASRASVALRLPPRPRGVLPPRFVGRDAELALARQAIAAVAAGEPRVLLVSGEAGIGKSRFLEEVKKAARMQGLTPCSGGAHDEQSYAFAAFLPVLDGFAREAERLPREPALLAVADTLARLHPRWAALGGAEIDPGPRAGAEEERFRILAAIADLVRLLARGPGLAIFVDDLQWADPASLELLAYLLRSLAADGDTGRGPAPVLLVASLRDEEVEPGSPVSRWRDAIRRAASATEVHLGRLEPGEAEAMARSMLGCEAVPAAVVSWLLAQSQGVPFLVAEMLGAFAAEGSLVLDARGRVELRRRLSGEIAFPEALPPPVAELVSRRLDKLDERERKVAAAAALVGAEVPFDLLLAASGIEEDDLLDALQVLLGRRILIESRDDPDLFQFSSKVVRDVLTEETFERRRRKAHERIARALEGRAVRRPEDVLGLAHHWLLGGDRPKGFTYLVETARFHRQNLHHDQAEAAVRRALDLLAEEPVLAPPRARLELVCEHGELQAARCVYEPAAAAFSELIEATATGQDADLRMRALLGLADLDLRRGEYGEAEQRTREALALAERAGLAGPLARAHTSLGRIAWHLGRPGDALQAFHQALAVESAGGNELGEATALHNIGYAHFARGEFAEAERHFQGGIERFRRRGHPLGVARGLEAMATVAQRRATYEEGALALAEARGLMRRLGDRRGEAYCVVSDGNIHAYRGRWLEALQLYDEAEQTFAELGETRGLAFCHSNRGRVLTSTGDFGSAFEALSQALRLARKIAERSEIAFCLYALAELHRELGDLAGASRHDAQAVALFAEQGESFGLGLALAGAAMTAAGRGEGVRAAGVARRALALAADSGGIPEVEARARIALAAASATASEAAGEAARAVSLAAAVGLTEIEALALGREAAAAVAAGDPARAAARRAAAVARIEVLATALESGRATFLRRPWIAAILAG